MRTPILFLTHSDADREADYPEAALAALRQVAEVRLNASPAPLQGDALIRAAAGAQIIIADRQTEGATRLFATSPQLVAFVRCAGDIDTVDVAAASSLGILVTQASLAPAETAVQTTRQVMEILKGNEPEGAVNPDPAHRLRRFAPPLAPEVGGTEGPEPTRYGDWQHKGRVTDF